jgi:hypothetical protein
LASQTDLSGQFQAVPMRLDTGLVGFAVAAVVKLVRVADGAVLPVSPLALPWPALFAVALPTVALGVLVVVSEAGTVGFAVPQWRSIVQAEWPQAPAGAAPVAAVANGLLQTRALARFGSGAWERLLPVPDLQQLAHGLHASGPAPAA